MTAASSCPACREPSNPDLCPDECWCDCHKASAALSRIRFEAENIKALATGPWGQGSFTGEPSKLAVQVRHENFAKLADAILAALDELEAERDA